jgi:formyltetrahydrofolate hydrolase
MPTLDILRDDFAAIARIFGMHFEIHDAARRARSLLQILSAQACAVLVRAVAWHVEHCIVRNERKTVVFAD